MTTLVFLHGWGATGNIWRRQVKVFSRQGIKVFTPTFPAWEASWLAGYLKELPLAETVLVGWSLGGMLLLEALSREPVKPGALVLVAVPASFCERPDHPWGQPRAVVRALRQAVREDPRRGLADFAKRCLAPGEAAFQEEILRDFQPQENGAHLTAGLNYLLSADLRPHLSGIPGGVLLLQGDQDAIVPPEQAEVLHQNLKEARMVRFSGAGHAPFLTRADEFNKVLGDLLMGGPGEGSPALP